LDVERFDSPRARWCTWTALRVPASSKILITRQPRDDGGEVARIYELLAASFGEDSVFLDADMVRSGSGFRDSIAFDLSSTMAVLVVIGPRWLDELVAGNYPLHADVVAAALDGGELVIPVLIGGARLPSQEELPVRLAALTRIASLEVTGSRFEYDVWRLVRRLTAAMADELAIDLEAPRGPFTTSVELEHMLVRAARAGIVPAAPRDNRIFDLASPEPATRPSRPRPPERPPRRPALHSPRPERTGTPGIFRRHVAGCRRKGGCDCPYVVVWRHRGKQRVETFRTFAEAREAKASRDAGGRRRPVLWRALGFAALAAGVGYLIADRLLGLVLEPLGSRSEPMDDVVCTVFAPPRVTPGQSFLVQTFVHLPEQADEARALAFEMDTEAALRVFRSLEAPIPRGGRLHFELRAPGLIIDDPVTSMVWQGRPDAVQFGVSVPPGASGPVIATLSISLDSAPLGHVKFKTTVDSPSAASLMSAAGAEPAPQGELARRYQAAFISYASKDRDKVLERVQMLPLVGVRYFQDLLNLDQATAGCVVLSSASTNMTCFCCSGPARPSPRNGCDKRCATPSSGAAATTSRRLRSSR
jgi:hypothetical protein